MRVAAILAALLALVTALPASAHFAQGTKVTTILVAVEDGGLVAFVRSPAPLLFSDVVREAQASRTPLTTPFLYLEETGAGLRYRIALDAIAADEAGFRERLESVFAWRQNGRALRARLLDYHLAARDPGGGFATIAEARAALSVEGARLDPEFGAAVVEAAFALDAPVAGGTLELRSTLPELPLPLGVSVDSHLVDARQEPPVSYTRPGQLAGWAVIDGSPWRAMLEFGWQGVLHILEGLDHVLLVVCLALGVGFSPRLLWLATAFTLGHSVTLVGTFLGAAPDWPWFVPAVETLIAASVVYAAVAAYRRSIGTIWIVAGIGLLHGFGFSFVLGDILGRDAPDLVASLAAFNVGIEVGQLAVIAATVLVLEGVRRLATPALVPLRTATLGTIGLVAGFWVVERMLAIA
jgi:hypothetical protein